MPQIKSAQKRVVQTAKRTRLNRAHKDRLKRATRLFRSSLAAKDPSILPDAVSAAHKAFDKAGVKGIIHKNAVNRRKSRTAIRANKTAAAVAAAAATAETAAAPALS